MHLTMSRSLSALLLSGALIASGLGATAATASDEETPGPVPAAVEEAPAPEAPAVEEAPAPPVEAPSVEEVPAPPGAVPGSGVQSETPNLGVRKGLPEGGKVERPGPAPEGATIQAFSYSIINARKAAYVNKSQVLGTCSVGKTGQSCTISRTVTATRTVSTDLGMSRSAITAKLGISNATSVATTISCASGPMAAGQVFRAYPRGTLYTYQIRRLQTTNTGYFYLTTSALKTAFDPTRNAIHCQ